MREMWQNVLISSRYTSLRICVRWEDVQSAVFPEQYEYWNSYVLPKFEFMSQLCSFITQGISERNAEFHDTCLKWWDDCCYSLVRYMSQVTNCDVDNIFQHYVLSNTCFWALDGLVANLKIKIWHWPVFTLNWFFHFLPRRDTAFCASAERTPVHWLRKAHTATGNKPGDCVWCGIGYWLLKTGDFFCGYQYHFTTLFVLSYGFLYRELSFMYLFHFIKKSGSEFGNIVF